MVLNKTRRDRRLCVLLCVFPYRVRWFGICQVNRLRTDGERCETPLISKGLFQKHRARAHAGPCSHVLSAETAPNVLHAGGKLLCPCTSGSSNLLPLSALLLPAPTTLSHSGCSGGTAYGEGLHTAQYTQPKTLTLLLHLRCKQPA